MTTPPNEPSQQSIFTRLSAALGLSFATPPIVVNPEQLDSHQRFLVAMELMKRNHLHSLVTYDDFRRNVFEIANQAKAQDPTAAEFIDDFVNESLADYSDELKLFVAAKNRALREEALKEIVTAVEVKDVTPDSSYGNPRSSDMRNGNIRQMFRRGFGIVVLVFLLLVVQSGFSASLFGGILALAICGVIGVWVFLFSFEN